MRNEIVLVNPPQKNSLDDHLDPPLGLMYIASSLQQNDIPVRIVDLSSKPEDSWQSLLGEGDIFGIEIFSPAFNVSKRISKLIRENNPEAVIVAGGPHPTALPQLTIEGDYFSHVITGEGEVVFPELIKNIEAKREVPKIINAEQIKNIDRLPQPARELVDILGYTREVEGVPATTAISSRGCPYTCNFCCKDTHGSTIRFRSPGNFLGEIQNVVERYGIKSFLFYDDVFTFNQNKRLEEICNGLRDIGVKFRCNGRAGVNTLSDFQMLHRSGCDEIAFGIESGSQQMLDRMGKRNSVEVNYQSIINAKKAGLRTKAYLISGFPGETEQTIKDTINFMERADPDKFTVFAFVPLPGCDVWKNPGSYGITNLSRDWDQYFNIAGQYQGGRTFETAEMSVERFEALHNTLVHALMKRGQRGKLQNYYKDLRNTNS